MEAITASLRDFGQTIPIVVQREGMIVRIGNGRLQAAKSLGWTHIAAVVTDTPEAAMKALGIADNRTGELATWNHAELARLLEEIQSDSPDLLGSVGFDMREIETLLTRYLPDVQLPADPTPVTGQEGATGAAGETLTGEGGNGTGEGATDVSNAFNLVGAAARYVNLTFPSDQFDQYQSAINFFKHRYQTTITPDALLRALVEFKESLSNAE
jgi:hypothetical protein